VSPIIRVDVGWVLQIQSAISPLNVPISDWGSLGYMADRHTFERERGVLYYEEIASRAATFLHTALLLRPFTDYNLVIGWACASQYMHLSGQSLQTKDDDLYELAQAVRTQEADLRTVAQRLESWRSE
jgi:prophage maintenance system killer protein